MNILHATACYARRDRTLLTLQPNLQVLCTPSSYDNYGPSFATIYILLTPIMKVTAPDVRIEFRSRLCARNWKSGVLHLQIDWRTFTLAPYRCLPQMTGLGWPTTTPFYFSTVTTLLTVQNLLFKCRTHSRKKTVSLTLVTVLSRSARHMRDRCALDTGNCTSRSGPRYSSHGVACTSCSSAG